MEIWAIVGGLVMAALGAWVIWLVDRRAVSEACRKACQFESMAGAAALGERTAQNERDQWATEAKRLKVELESVRTLYSTAQSELRLIKSTTMGRVGFGSLPAAKSDSTIPASINKSENAPKTSAARLRGIPKSKKNRQGGAA